MNKMEAAVPIISKALDNAEPVGQRSEHHSNRKESTLSNRTLKNTVTAIKTKQQGVILLLLILLIILTELLYNMLKKNQPSKE